jgi:hypothetical protein
MARRATESLLVNCIFNNISHNDNQCLLIFQMFGFSVLSGVKTVLENECGGSEIYSQPIERVAVRRERNDLGHEAEDSLG